MGILYNYGTYPRKQGRLNYSFTVQYKGKHILQYCGILQTMVNEHENFVKNYMAQNIYLTMQTKFGTVFGRLLLKSNVTMRCL